MTRFLVALCWMGALLTSTIQSQTIECKTTISSIVDCLEMQGYPYVDLANEPVADIALTFHIVRSSAQTDGLPASLLDGIVSQLNSSFAGAKKCSSLSIQWTT